jgi:hypothetical protein
MTVGLLRVNCPLQGYDYFSSSVPFVHIPYRRRNLTQLATSVEGHDDVCAKRQLHVHRVLGREKVGGSVQVGAEFHAFFADW